MRMMIKRRVALVLVGQAGYFDIAQLKLPNQTFEDSKPVRALGGIVVEMSVCRENYVDSKGRKLIQKPLWIQAGRIVPPRIDQHRQTGRGCDLECSVSVELDLDIARSSWISADFLNGNQRIVIPRGKGSG